MPDVAPVNEGYLRTWVEASGAHLCVLFGSRAGNGPQVKGDVDLALRFSKLPSPDRRLEILGELQDVCGVPDVDLVFLHERTEPVLRFEIFRTGRPVFENVPGLFIEEKVRALMLFEDALPFRRLRRELLRRNANGDKNFVP